MTADDRYWMERALALAAEGEARGEVPIGAVVIYNGQEVGRAYNQPIGRCDPTAHAEILALRQACEHVGNYRLPGATVYATLEPCPMCAGAMVHARIRRLVYGAGDSRNGAAGSVLNVLQQPAFNHMVETTGGVLAETCAEQLRAFFRQRRG